MLNIYKDCEHLKDYGNNCWNCHVRELCQACKTNGCTNEEKEFVIKETIKETWKKLDVIGG